MLFFIIQTLLYWMKLAGSAIQDQILSSPVLLERLGPSARATDSAFVSATGETVGLTVLTLGKPCHGLPGAVFLVANDVLPCLRPCHVVTDPATAMAMVGSHLNGKLEASETNNTDSLEKHIYFNLKTF